MHNTYPAPEYNPGLHVICDLETETPDLLQDCEAFRNLLDSLINKHGLTKLGEVYHSFPQAGFTAVVCLTESHIAIHTWPEYNKATFDVFLSNYQHVNDGHAKAISQSIISYFKATTHSTNEIKR